LVLLVETEPIADSADDACSNVAKEASFLDQETVFVGWGDRYSITLEAKPDEELSKQRKHQIIIPGIIS
jgi:hypothetical protein